MRICPNCSTKNFDVNTKCEKCDYPLTTKHFENVVTLLPENASVEPKSMFYIRPKSVNGLQSVAKAFMIVSCVFFSLSFITIIVLWMAAISLQIVELSVALLSVLFIFLPIFIDVIYMTYSYSYKIANGIKVGISFKIITLLFCSFIAGILMLCDND